MDIFLNFNCGTEEICPVLSTLSSWYSGPRVACILASLDALSAMYTTHTCNPDRLLAMQTTVFGNEDNTHLQPLSEKQRLDYQHITPNWESSADAVSAMQTKHPCRP